MRRPLFTACRLCGARWPVSTTSGRAIGLERHWEGCRLLRPMTGKVWFSWGQPRTVS